MLIALVEGASNPRRPRASPSAFVLPLAKSMMALAASTALRPKASSPSGPPTKMATTVMASTIHWKISQNCSHADFAQGEWALATVSMLAAALVAAELRSVPASLACWTSPA